MFDWTVLNLQQERAKLPPERPLIGGGAAAGGKGEEGGKSGGDDNAAGYGRKNPPENSGSKGEQGKSDQQSGSQKYGAVAGGTGQ